MARNTEDREPPITVMRVGDNLYPLSPYDADRLREQPSGKALAVEVRRLRSVKQNRLYWALLRLVVDNLDQDVEPHALHDWLKLKLGIKVPVIQRNGEVIWLPGSTAFDEMEPPDFNRYFRKAAELLVEHLIPGLRVESLEREARKMLESKQENADGGQGDGRR